MKKSIHKIIDLLLILSLLCCVYSFVSLKVFEYNTAKRVDVAYKEKGVNADNVLSKYPNAILKDGSNVSDEDVELLKKNISLVDKSILDAFFSKKGKVVLTSKDISKTYYDGSVKGSITGLFDGTTNTVYIEAKPYSINYATVHEFGHVLDSLTDWTTVSDVNGFNAVYKDDIDSFITYARDEHHKSNTREYLAQSFKEYILDGDRLSANTPSTFNYVSDLVGNVGVK